VDNRDRNPQLTVEQNAAMIEPGMEHGTEAFRKSVCDEVKQVLDQIYATHGQGKWKQKVLINDRIADSIFQQVVTRADEYQVLAAPNLNGDTFRTPAPRKLEGSAWPPGRTSAMGMAVLRPRTARRPIRGQGCNQSEFGDAVGRDDV